MKEAARLFKSLSDETRLRLLLLLLERGEACVCEIVEATGMAQSTVSRHLGILKNAGLVRSRRQGLWMFYAETLTGGAHELRELADALRSWLRRDARADTDLTRLDACLCRRGQKGGCPVPSVD